MKAVERRQRARLNHRTPLRFRAAGVAADKTEHFTEALNISRGGFFFASSAPLQVGMPLEVTIRMPAEVTGNSAQEMRCTAHVVHVRNEPYGDGRIGFVAELNLLFCLGYMRPILKYCRAAAHAFHKRRDLIGAIFGK